MLAVVTAIRGPADSLESVPRAGFEFVNVGGDSIWISLSGQGIPLYRLDMLSDGEWRGATPIRQGRGRAVLLGDGEAIRFDTPLAGDTLRVGLMTRGSSVDEFKLKWFGPFVPSGLDTLPLSKFYEE
jgi:hypothetical protein